MSTDHKALLKELVEAPFGKAEVILKSKGLWDEKRKATDGTEKTYTVTVFGEMRVSGRVKVKARSDEEAEQLAMEEAEDSNFDWDYDDVEATNAVVESCDG